MTKKDYLYSIEIVKECCYSVMPRQDEYVAASEDNEVEEIPIGTKGKIIEKFGDKFFKADENIDDLFTMLPEVRWLIPYDYIEGHYKIIDDSEHN